MSRLFGPAGSTGPPIDTSDSVRHRFGKEDPPRSPVELTELSATVSTATTTSVRSPTSNSASPLTAGQSLAAQLRPSGVAGRFRSLKSRFVNWVLRVKTVPASKDGRIIPLNLSGNPLPAELCAPFGTLDPTPVDLEGRLIDERTGKPYCDNLITSSIYTAYTFFPRQLYVQMSKLANLYLFIMAFLQMVPSFSTTGNYTTIIPLSVFTAIAMAREGWDDWRRHRLDREENTRVATVLVPVERAENDARFRSSAQEGDGKTRRIWKSTNSNSNKHRISKSTKNHNHKSPLARVAVPWQDVQVGDVLELRRDDWVPADILLLQADGIGGSAFVETMALDGETNLKTRQPHPEIAKVCHNDSALAETQAVIISEDPNRDLYNYAGTCAIGSKRYALGPDHVVYRGSVLRNTPRAVGIVVFSGEETKIRMNALKNARTKAPKLAGKINRTVILMFGIVIFLGVFCTVGSVIYYNSHVTRMSYLQGAEVGLAPKLIGFIIMFNTLIPLSLYVSMELIKVMQMLLLQWDLDMYDAASDTPCESRTATILEELGQVSYVFSDKTGTLTDNVMVFRKLSVGGQAWLHSVDVEGTENGGGGGNGAASGANDNSADADMWPTTSATSAHTWRSSAAPQRPQDLPNTEALITYLQRFPDTVYARKMKFFLLNLALCHTCLPQRKSAGSDADSDSDSDDSDSEGRSVVSAGSNSDFSTSNSAFSVAASASAAADVASASASASAADIEYQASSPDELALVGAARDLGYILIDRDVDKITIRTFPNGPDAPPRDEKYTILETIEFSSARKRMSVVVRFPNGRICVLCKGADNVILPRLAGRSAAATAVEVARQSALRRTAEAEYVLANRTRMSLEMPAPRRSLAARGSLNLDRGVVLESIDDLLHGAQAEEAGLEDIAAFSRRSFDVRRQRKYGAAGSGVAKSSGVGVGVGSGTGVGTGKAGGSIPGVTVPSDALCGNDAFVLEQTLQHVEQFSTEGLRTLLYAHRWIDGSAFTAWQAKFQAAKTAVTDRQAKIESVAELIESDFALAGATAIEDKLQDGVADAIEKLRRAGIRLWMLTGDKRETAINIGYSCRLIKDYSTVVVLSLDAEGGADGENGENGESTDLAGRIAAATLEIEAGRVAHCVAVIDGATLATVQADMTLLSLFVELGIRADSVICCRASPAQKAAMVDAVRQKAEGAVTLAIGDGANDIAMIQSADIGIGITGKEGLQAARAADYSIAQFRFLLKLLLVHGRYNYLRTCKYILCTFYKEFLFYASMGAFQRNTMYTGTQPYDDKSLMFFNTLFTSLPVMCIGAFDRDLRPETLLAVPELYAYGRGNRGYNARLVVGWLALAAAQMVLVSFGCWYLFGFPELEDNTLFPIGSLQFGAAVVIINAKCQLLEMHERGGPAAVSFALSVGGWVIWQFALLLFYRSSQNKIYLVRGGFVHRFGREAQWWATLVALIAICLLLDVAIQAGRRLLWPSDVHVFQELEKDPTVWARLQEAAGGATGAAERAAGAAGAVRAARARRAARLWFHKLTGGVFEDPALGPMLDGGSGSGSGSFSGESYSGDGDGDGTGRERSGTLSKTAPHGRPALRTGTSADGVAPVRISGRTAAVADGENTGRLDRRRPRLRKDSSSLRSSEELMAGRSPTRSSSEYEMETLPSGEVVRRRKVERTADQKAGQKRGVLKKIRFPGAGSRLEEADEEEEQSRTRRFGFRSGRRRKNRQSRPADDSDSDLDIEEILQRRGVEFEE